LLGPRLLPLVFGGGFERARGVLSVLMWSFVPFCLVKLLGSGLIASNHQLADLLINVAVLAVTVAFLVVLVPVAAALGAAWGVMGSVASAMILRVASFRLRIVRLSLGRRTLGPALAGGLLALVLLSTDGFPLPIVLAAAALAYPIGLVLFGAFEP